jgi:DNA-binding MarR family transcriptional regulator
MNRAPAKSDRVARAEHISTALPAHLGLLVRLLTKELGERYSYTEARLLSAISNGPQRITDLAAAEGLAQPTMTLLVKRLEERGLVRRERQTHDQRVVLVYLTNAGEAAVKEFRGIAAAGLRRHLDAMPDRELKALAAATDVLAELIAALQAPSDGSQRTEQAA